MDEKIIEENGGNFIRDVLLVLKRYIVLLLAVIFVFTAGGVVYSYLRKPNYTYGIKLSFQASTEEGTAVTYNINAMRAYIDTIVDFCDEGVVVDRADFYYMKFIDYKKEKQGENLTTQKMLDSFISELTQEGGEFSQYKPDTEKESRYKKENINVSTVVVENATQFVFSVEYTEKNAMVTEEMATILAVAYAHEISLKEDDSAKYFSGLEISLKNLGPTSSGPVIDMGKKKIVMIAVVIGVIVALGAVYLVNVLDNTVKEKSELERITGTTVIAMINKEGGNGRG